MKKLLLLVPFIVFIISCGGEVDYFPLAVGNAWNYIITMTQTTATDTLEAPGTQNVEITEETTLDDGTEVFEQVEISTTIFDPDTFVDTNITYIEETDDYIRSYEDKSDTLPETWLEFPIEEGNTWDVNDTMTAEVLGKQDVSVPADDFADCWEIGYITNGDTIFSYFADGVGEVRNYFEFTDTNTTSTREMELENATIH